MGQDILGSWVKFKQNGLEIGENKLWDSVEIDNSKVLDRLDSCIYIMTFTTGIVFTQKHLLWNKSRE